jgi:hypothetical protein
MYSNPVREGAALGPGRSLRHFFAMAAEIDAIFICGRIRCPHICCRKDQIMGTDLWNRWLLLRLLLEFAVVAAFLAFALLKGWYEKSREARVRGPGRAIVEPPIAEIRESAA